MLRGAALARHGDSYLDRAQRIAELESELKLERFIRDIPKYERMQATLNGEEDKEGKRDSVEDLFFAGRVGSAHY
jgi:hypothetical protein